MKKHLTNVVIGDKKFSIPKKQAKAILSLVESIEESHNSRGSSEIVYKEIAKERPKGAVYLRGIRTREDMGQKELADLTDIPVSNISKYENGTRRITVPIAKKLASVLKINYKMLLEI